MKKLTTLKMQRFPLFLMIIFEVLFPSITALDANFSEMCMADKKLFNFTPNVVLLQANLAEPLLTFVDPCHLSNTSNTPKIVFETFNLTSQVTAYDLDQEKGLIYVTTQSQKLFRIDLSNQNPKETSLELISEFEHFTPSGSIALDWLHDLLYLVVDQSDIVVGSVRRGRDGTDLRPFRTTHLLSLSSITIKTLLVVPSLSQLVWQEIDWSGKNANRIRVSQQDGTDPLVLYKTDSFIYHLEVDQVNLALYFTMGDVLVQMTLLPSQQYQMAKMIERGTTIFPLRHNRLKNFALYNPYIVELLHYTLMAHTLDHLNSRLDDRTDLGKILVNFGPKYLMSPRSADYRLYGPHSQAIHHVEPLCSENFCQDLCLPNGARAKFTCFCFNHTTCDDFGQYDHEVTVGSITTTITPITSPSAKPETIVVNHHRFHEDDFWKHWSPSTEKPKPTIPEDLTQKNSNSNSDSNITTTDFMIIEIPKPGEETLKEKNLQQEQNRWFEKIYSKENLASTLSYLDQRIRQDQLAIVIGCAVAVVLLLLIRIVCGRFSKNSKNIISLQAETQHPNRPITGVSFNHRWSRSSSNPEFNPKPPSAAYYHATRCPQETRLTKNDWTLVLADFEDQPSVTTTTYGQWDYSNLNRSASYSSLATNKTTTTLISSNYCNL